MPFFTPQENHSNQLSSAIEGARNAPSVHSPMFQRPPSQTLSIKARPGSSITSAVLSPDNNKNRLADFPLTSVPENLDFASDNEMKVNILGTKLQLGSI